MAAFEERAREESTAISSQIPPDLPEFLLDPNRLRQILFNLLGNAVKFTHGGKVDVSVTLSPSATDPQHVLLEISVHDTGIGISPENLVRLGRPFVQLEKGTGQMQGTGLGLAICRQMLDRMGGELRIESELGVGSTFTVRLLDVEVRDAPEAPPTPEMPPPDSLPPIVVDGDDLWKRRWVLLVDDVPLTLSILATMCRRLGLTNIGAAQSGQEALELLRVGSYDLVLTDLWMPGMDGAALLDAIRHDPALASLPVYAVSADVEILKNYKRLGFDGILLKPVLLDNLRKLLSTS